MGPLKKIIVKKIKNLDKKKIYGSQKAMLKLRKLAASLRAVLLVAFLFSGEKRQRPDVSWRSIGKYKTQYRHCFFHTQRAVGGGVFSGSF